MEEVNKALIPTVYIKSEEEERGALAMNVIRQKREPRGEVEISVGGHSLTDRTCFSHMIAHASENTENQRVSR